MKWLEEFKEDVLRRSAYLQVEDDNLILVSHKTVDRLIAIAERLKSGEIFVLSPYCLACGGEAITEDDWSHKADCILHSDEWTP